MSADPVGPAAGPPVAGSVATGLGRRLGPHLDGRVPKRLAGPVDWALSWTTDPDGPLRQGRYRSPLRDERVAAVLGATLGLLFSICFVTGLYSHLQQHPQGWLPIPPRPAGLYRVTQGFHVASGIASVPVLLAKLWVVWPRFVAFPPFRTAAQLVERIGLLPLVGGGIFLVFSGVANIAQWYPWRFSFTASHFWMSWVAMGALVAHVGAQWVITRRTFTRPSRRPALAAADPVLGASAEVDDGVDVVGPVDEAADAVEPVGVEPVGVEPAAVEPVGAGTAGAGVSRRGFLLTVAGASGVLTVVTVGQTLGGPLRPLALLAPRDPASGPQGYPVNRGAANAGVVDLATSADYRLTIEGGRSPLSLTLDELLALDAHDAHLPIACVEGWSFSARWRGVRVRDLLAVAGAPSGAGVSIESLEPVGAYRTSTLTSAQVTDRDTLLATHLDGQPLVLDHGAPCRLIAPNRPGVLQTKWVTRVVVR